jgi:hypothetical protein
MSKLESSPHVGALFSPATVDFLMSIHARAKYSPEVTFSAVSSEASTFKRLFQLLEIELPTNMAFHAEINRSTVLKALVVAATAHDGNLALSLRQIMRFAEGQHRVTDVLRLMGDDASDLLTSNMTPDELSEFLAARLERVIAGSVKSFDHVEALLELHLDRTIKLVDVGWNGSIQVFTRELASLLGSSSRVEGLYLATRESSNPFGITRGRMEGLVFPNIDAPENRGFFVPEIWEYVLSEKSEYSSSSRHRQIQEGLKLGAMAWRNELHCSPDEFFFSTKPSLKRLLMRPTRREVEILGSIQWEAGFSAKWSYSLVDLSRSRSRYFVKAIMKPRTVMRELLYSPIAWKRGFISYYRLTYMLPFLRLASRRRGLPFV